MSPVTPLAPLDPKLQLARTAEPLTLVATSTSSWPVGLSLVVIHPVKFRAGVLMAFRLRFRVSGLAFGSRVKGRSLAYKAPHCRLQGTYLLGV